MTKGLVFIYRLDLGPAKVVRKKHKNLENAHIQHCWTRWTESPVGEGLDLPYSFDRVWNAAISVFQQAKWNVTKADKATGGIEVHIVMDMITWTETFYVNLTRNNDNSTRIIMGRIGVAQPVDWGISRQYVESFLNKLELALKSIN